MVPRIGSNKESFGTYGGDQRDFGLSKRSRDMVQVHGEHRRYPGPSIRERWGRGEMQGDAGAGRGQKGGGPGNGSD